MVDDPSLKDTIEGASAKTAGREFYNGTVREKLNWEGGSGCITSSGSILSLLLKVSFTCLLVFLKRVLVYRAALLCTISTFRIWTPY